MKSSFCGRSSEPDGSASQQEPEEAEEPENAVLVRMRSEERRLRSILDTKERNVQLVHDKYERLLGFRGAQDAEAIQAARDLRQMEAERDATRRLYDSFMHDFADAVRQYGVTRHQRWEAKLQYLLRQLNEVGRIPQGAERDRRLWEFLLPHSPPSERYG